MSQIVNTRLSAVLRSVKGHVGAETPHEVPCGGTDPTEHVNVRAENLKPHKRMRRGGGTPHAQVPWGRGPHMRMSGGGADPAT